jgi:hypothetical protein
MINTVLKKSAVTMVAGLALSPLLATSFTSVHADTTAEQQSQSSQDNKDDVSPLSNTDKAKIDPHVVVVDNQFELLGTADSIGVSEETYENAKNTISKANDAINESSEIINSKTKVATGKATNQVVNTSNKKSSYKLTSLTVNKTKKGARIQKLGNSNYTYAYFWWGCRYYFTSNAAVQQLQDEFNDYASQLAIAGVISAPISPAAGVCAGVGGWYFSNVAQNLDKYNRQHMQSRIYLDMGYSTTYSFGTF